MPGDLRQRALHLRAVVEQLAHVVDEVGLRLRVALLVARARAQHQQALGARGADVEQVALAVEAVLAHREHQAAGRGDRATILVRQERLGDAPARELALLEAAAQHGLEAPRPDRLRGGHLDAVGLGRLAHAHLRAGRARAARAPGPPPRPEHRAQLGERARWAGERAGLLELGAAQHGRGAPVGRGEQAREPASSSAANASVSRARASRSSSSSGQRSRLPALARLGRAWAPSRRTSASRLSAKPGTRRSPGVRR